MAVSAAMPNELIAFCGRDRFLPQAKKPGFFWEYVGAGFKPARTVASRKETRFLSSQQFFRCAIAVGREMLQLVNCRKPPDAIIMPTESQLLKCLVLCQILSNCYRPIQLVRYDDKRKEIFIIAGELGNIEITIFEKGQWRYDITQA